ncbi:hypothetical protein [Saccharopolyspora spinosa]|uniref:MYXO-CTERM domain-containing protein n=1 Tax=Saccharopolyspora spinosa TaxID=60894 RepID=A0A2N3XPP8_SACSN|nr:hypothetical protein [Saccharopolyspora spinosa]PKW12645.1 hypothetical protein A8926_0117 [Saccharopolyspora spinosa]
MWRTGRVLAGLAIALFLLFAPPALAEGRAAPTEASVVLAQEPGPPPAPPAQPPPDERQRLALGVTGVVLIALVLLSRKLRKKAVFFVKWKK